MATNKYKCKQSVVQKRVYYDLQLFKNDKCLNFLVRKGKVQLIICHEDIERGVEV
jgi:hypothetical protein